MNKTIYEELIQKAEYCYYLKRYDEAVGLYGLALKEKQAGSITKKRVSENIVDLKRLQNEKIRRGQKPDGNSEGHF